MREADTAPPPTIPHVYLECKHLSVTWKGKGRSRAMVKRDLGPPSPAPQERGFQGGKGLQHKGTTMLLSKEPRYPSE